jgi:hypothetical protein
MSFGSLGAASALEQENMSDEEIANDEYIVESDDVAGPVDTDEISSSAVEENVSAMETTEPPALEIYQNSELKKSYSMEDLRNNFDQKQYAYSSFNSWPTADITTNVAAIIVVIVVITLIIIGLFRKNGSGFHYGFNFLYHLFKITFHNGLVSTKRKNSDTKYKCYKSN